MADRGPSRLTLFGAAVIVLIVAAICLVVLSGLGHQAADYSVDIQPGISPRMSAAAAADVAVAYLNRQTPNLAAPSLHIAPQVTIVSASTAIDVRTLEPAVNPAIAAAQGNQIVWVVLANGDFLNLVDLEWSSAGAPAQKGTIVIDDATSTILGVYPHLILRPGQASPAQPSR